MNNLQRHTLSWAIIIVGLLILGFIIWSQISPKQQVPGRYDSFASCLTEKGMVFYGAFWCPHCQKIKREFGSGMKNIKYVECSTPDGRGQIKFCADKKIEGYPTFEFADGSRLIGEVAFSKFAEKTGCPLPDNISTPSTTQQ